MLVAPAAARIGNKRLLIVGEGVLQYLPFGALPEPQTDGQAGPPLIVHHEIVTAPSASVIAVLRQETAGRAPAPNGVAVFADPIFSLDDARVAATAGNQATRQKPGGKEYPRLRFSRAEADAITALAPTTGLLKAVDFDASRQAVLQSDLGRYRIVHFATHSVIDSERPELSGVVLSLVDRAGKPQNGFLRLLDIYNLRLGADLVVLSACETALGQEVRGEGLVGLTRGFLYAGASRVVATLWSIDDRVTAEAMKRFYSAMLSAGERPAAALRQAQVAMWEEKGWAAPYYWAAFVLQGEWR
jgi:CHAT domain-containing protein